MTEQQAGRQGSGSERRWTLEGDSRRNPSVIGPDLNPEERVEVVPESSLTAALARISDLEEGNWPYEWQVATKEREARKAAEQRVRELEEEAERLAHGICDALDEGHPTKPILRSLLRGTAHEGHRSLSSPQPETCPWCGSDRSEQRGHLSAPLAGDMPLCDHDFHTQPGTEQGGDTELEGGAG